MSDEPEDDIPAIVAFVKRPDAEHPPLGLIAKRDPNACEHKQTIIDVKARRLYCQKCNVDMDPYEQLNKLAHYGMNLESRVEALRQQREKEKQIAERERELTTEAAKKTLPTLREGDEVSVDHKFSTVNASVKAVVDGKLELVWRERNREFPAASIPVEEITRIRVKKRAR